MRISVIIPVLNEVRNLADCVSPVQPVAHEVRVVDGGSGDGTVDLARSLGCTVINAAPGRASQMNLGASAATGDVLLFLHADTRLPDGWPAHISRALASGAVWGRFDVRLDSSRPLLRMVGAMMNLRSRISGIATGDQAIFLTRETWLQLGGFARIALMEDVELCGRLRRLSLRPACVRTPVLVSARRWEKHGIWRTILVMWWLRLLYFAGVSPVHLHRRYYGREPKA